MKKKTKKIVLFSVIVLVLVIVVSSFGYITYSKEKKSFRLFLECSSDDKSCSIDTNYVDEHGIEGGFPLDNGCFKIVPEMQISPQYIHVTRVCYNGGCFNDARKEIEYLTKCVYQFNIENYSANFKCEC